MYTKTIEIRENYTNKIIEQPMWLNWTQYNENKPFWAHILSQNPLFSSISVMGPDVNVDNKGVIIILVLKLGNLRVMQLNYV